MSTASYMLPVPPVVLDHGLASSVPSWLGDFVEEEGVREFNALDAMAASGDYFITLATRLDKLAQNLEYDSSEQIEVEHLVKTLFYMQDHYDLVAKYKTDNRRQK